MADDPAAPAPSPATPTDPATPAAPAVSDPTPPVDPQAAKPTDKPTEPAPFTLTKYDFSKVELPKGIELDQPLIDAVTPVLIEAKVPQELASKLVDAQVKHLAKVEEKREADFKAWMAENVTNYQNTLKKEWAGNYDANLAIAQKGMARIAGSPEMKKLLDDTGLGNHPLFVKAFFEVGRMVSEDKPPNGATPPNARKPLGEVLYGATQ